MAAGQVVCPFFGVVFARLNSLIDNDRKRLRPLVGMVKAQLTELNRSFCKIKDVLDDAEEKQFDEEAVRSWLKDLNDASYEADDVFDGCDYHGGLQQQQKASAQHPGTGYQMAVPKQAISNKFTEQQLYEKVQILIEMFQASAEECSGLGLQKRKGKSVVISSDRRTHSFLTEPKVYGRDDDRERLVWLLDAHIRHPGSARSSSSLEDNLSVFPIVGMGGVGKTTVAQMVYNDDQVKTHFDFRFWVCVSDDFDTERIIKDIVASLPRPPSAFGELEKLCDHFHSELSNKTFLLVLDDVSEESQVKWNKLKRVLRGGAQGSSIILTTRLENVARIADAHPYYLEGLSENESWNLFKQYAFGRGNKENPALKEIGKEIVKKCEGLPLIAKTIGELLSVKTEEKEWIAVKETEIWELLQSRDNDILLSYYNFPSNLKQCFAYCSVFPKDYQIERVKLIQLWMANGFVQSRASMELEDVGNEIFNELLQRSFFKDVEKDEDGNIRSCKMHGLLHDLAIYIARNESRVMLDGGSAGAITERTRHLFVQSDSEVLPSSILEPIKRSAPCLRSLVERSANIMNTKSLLNSGFLVSDFIYLRALDLYTSSGIEVVLPALNAIGELIHLRYLELSGGWGGDFTLLPESICLLRNLQTLKLKGCSYLESLPTDMRKMRSLRCLDIQDCDNLTSMPVGMGQLTSLRTLSIFIVGMESGRALSELQGLNLGGKLEIQGLQHVKTTMDAGAANLASKKNLCSLSLEWPWLGQLREQNAKEEKKEESESHSESELQQHQEVIEGLRPHTNLKVLNVYRYDGLTFSPSWLTASGVPNLVRISLRGCRRCERLSPLGKLGFLKVLDLSFMDSLKFIVMDDDDDARTFWSLEELGLWYMRDLEGWSSSSLSSQAAIAPVFPRLSKVSVYGCPNLKTLPVQLKSLTRLTELTIQDCRNLVSLAEEEGGLIDLSSLKTLKIDDCNALKRLPQFYKTYLRTLEISDCPQMEFSTDDFEHLFSLEEITLHRLPKLTFFPEGIKHTAARLHCLDFQPCSENGAMDLPDWISTLTSLQVLSISAPKNWKMLPQWLQYFTALQDLSIYGCDEELERRWKNKDEERGDNCFNMISHVSCVEISSNVWSDGY